MTNRDKLRAWMRNNKMSARQTAELLSKITGDQISVKTIENWRGDPDAYYTSPTPGWVVYVLANEQPR